MTRATTILAGMLLAFFVAMPLRADEGAAKFFTERGMKAVDDGDLDEAERNFTKALGEQDGWVPALLGLAKVWQGRGEKDRAIGYLTEILDRRDRGELKASDREIADQAVEILKEIDRPRLEYRELVQAYVAKLVDLAERSAKKSPDLASRCLARILRVAPDHPAAARLQKEYGIRPPSSAGGPAAAAANETLLFNGKDISDWTGSADIWSVRDGMLVATAGDAAWYMRHTTELEGDYTIIYEVRVKEDTGSEPVVGFQWALTGVYQTYNLLMFDDKFLMEHVHGGPDQKEKLATTDFYQIKGGVDRSVFNRFEVRVKGNRATCLVNGKEICRYDAPDRSVFKGYPSILVQCCTAEFRKIAFIR